MKKIGIDARLYFQTGVGVYLRNILHYLQLSPPKNTRFYIYILKQDASYITFNNKNFITRPVLAKWHTLQEQVGFLNDIYGDKLDLMHFTYFSYPILYKEKFIATIHDLTPLKFKTGRASTKNRFIFELKHRAFEFVLSRQVANATKIITPTETVKKQLSKIYGSKVKDKTKAIYEGVDYELMETKPNMDLRHRFPQRFFLYVGNFYPHKNVERLVDAFKKIQKDVNLVLIGPNNYFSERLKYKIHSEKITSVFLFHKANTADLVYFYKNSLALINPSLSEGFGLPIIEATYFNLPIIASNLEVFHELLGNQFISIDPNSTSDIESKINYFLQNRPKVDYGNILEKYSFRKMTEEISDLYKDLVAL